MSRPQKITFADMRDMGVRGLLIYCADFKCSHLITMSGDRWPDHMRLSDLEPRFVCKTCGKRIDQPIKPHVRVANMPDEKVRGGPGAGLKFVR